MWTFFWEGGGFSLLMTFLHILSKKSLDYGLKVLNCSWSRSCIVRFTRNWLCFMHFFILVYLLRNGDDIVTESSTIVNYLENSFSDVQVECDQDQSVLHLTQGFFPAFAAFMKKVFFVTPAISKYRIKGRIQRSWFLHIFAEPFFLFLAPAGGSIPAGLFSNPAGH